LRPSPPEYHNYRKQSSKIEKQEMLESTLLEVSLSFIAKTAPSLDRVVLPCLTTSQFMIK
jgi:hypothetical protein